MPASLNDFLGTTTKAAGAITGNIWGWISAHPIQFILILEGVLFLGGLIFIIKLWADQLPETKIIMLRGKNKAKVFGQVIKGESWTWGTGDDADTYIVPAHPLTIDEGIWGTKPLVMYEEGNPKPLYYNRRTGQIEADSITASAFKKVMDNEQLKILATPRNSPKDLIMGIAIGAAASFLVFFILAAFKIVSFGKCPVCGG